MTADAAQAAKCDVRVQAAPISRAWYCHCVCGWRSPVAISEHAAHDMAAHHIVSATTDDGAERAEAMDRHPSRRNHATGNHPEKGNKEMTTTAEPEEVVTTDVEVFRARRGAHAILQRHDILGERRPAFDVYVDRGRLMLDSCDDAAALESFGQALTRAGQALKAAKKAGRR